MILPLFTQILLRVSTFILNGIVLRYVHAHLLGVVNLRYGRESSQDTSPPHLLPSPPLPLPTPSPPHPYRLTLLYNTVLFLSREALRKAGLTRSADRTEWSHTSNLMWCW